MREIFRLAWDARMSADAGDTAEVMLFGKIIENTPEAWKCAKEDQSAMDFKKGIENVRKSGASKLLLRINSPGGVCTESIAMRSILANAGFEEITVRIEGLCASAATNIATLPGARVEIAEGSEYMIHNPWSICIGDANEMQHTIERLRNIEEMSRGFYMQRTGASEEQVREWMDAETWFTADQAVETGFADTVLRAEVSAPIAACAGGDMLSVMRSLYRHVPEEISNGQPVAGLPTEIHVRHEEDDSQMDINELTLDQLRAGNPALLDEIQQSAVAAERQRYEDIDALTLPGYEDMAAQAKANGTTALDFQKQLVQAVKQRGAEFMQARQKETAPAANVAGTAPENNGRTEEQEIEENAKAVAAYASAYTTSQGSGMF